MVEQEQTVTLLGARSQIQQAQAQAIAAQQQAAAQQAALQTQQALRSGGLSGFQQRQIQQQNIAQIQKYSSDVGQQSQQLETYLKTPQGIRESAIEAGTVSTTTKNVFSGLGAKEPGNYPETTTTYTSPFGYGSTSEKSGGVPQYQTIALSNAPVTYFPAENVKTIQIPQTKVSGTTTAQTVPLNILNKTPTFAGFPVTQPVTQTTTTKFSLWNPSTWFSIKNPNTPSNALSITDILLKGSSAIANVIPTRNISIPTFYGGNLNINASPLFKPSTSQVNKSLVQALDLFVKGSIFAPYMTTGAARKQTQEQEQVQEEKPTEEKPKTEIKTTSGVKFTQEDVDTAINNLRITKSNEELREGYRLALERNDPELKKGAEELLKRILGEDAAKVMINDVQEQEAQTATRFFPPSSRIPSLTDTGLRISSAPTGKIEILPPLETRFETIFTTPTKIPQVSEALALFGGLSNLFGNKSKTIQPTVLALSPTTKTNQTPKISTTTKQAPTTTTKQTPKTTTNQVSSPAQAPAVIQTPAQAPAVIQTPALTQPTAQISQQSPTITFGFDIGFPPISNIPFGFGQPMTKEEKKKLLSKRIAYTVLVKRRGKFFEIAKGLPQGRALKVGAEKAISTLARTFQLQPSGETEMLDISYFPSNRIFRPPKRPTGNPLTFVQRVGLTRGTGEVPEIQYYRRLKARSTSNLSKSIGGNKYGSKKIYTRLGTRRTYSKTKSYKTPTWKI